LPGAHTPRVRKILILTSVLLSSAAPGAQGSRALEESVIEASGSIRAGSPPLALDDPENAKAEVHRDPCRKLCRCHRTVAAPDDQHQDVRSHRHHGKSLSKVFKLKVCH
jgi:hypothetical protein